MNILTKNRSTDIETQKILYQFPDFLISNIKIGDNAETNEEAYNPSTFIETNATLGNESLINKDLINKLKISFTNELLSLLQEEYFEYGVETKADILVKQCMNHNSLFTKEWLNSIFVDNFDNSRILIGLLRIVARIEYDNISPQGAILATAALSHKNIEVQECAVRAFESWGTKKSIRILENVKVSVRWLQEYINEVVSDLQKEV